MLYAVLSRRFPVGLHDLIMHAPQPISRHDERDQKCSHALVGRHRSLYAGFGATG
jgi:hypothetical protein